MIVVADTSPVNYLLLIDAIHVLPSLYGRVLIPPKVHGELCDPAGPKTVRAWASAAPDWLEIRAVTSLIAEPSAVALDAGEVEAISLAIQTQADQLLIDDRRGRQVAEAHGLLAVGTLGILGAAGEAGLLDLRVAVDRLRHTNFHVHESLLAWLLERADDGGSSG